MTTRESGVAIRNLWPLYVHDISPYDDRRPNRYGIISEVEERETFEGPGGWWSKPDELFPYLALVDGQPAGFNLTASGEMAKSLGADFVLYEMFVVSSFRGSEVATRTAIDGFARHRGNWEVATWVDAFRPAAFWRKVLPRCATAVVRETEEDHAFGRRICWRFSNE